MIKKIAKRAVVSVLGWQVRRLRRKRQFRVVAVAGSIGKTSTKFAVASILKQSFRVRFQQGNYNDPVSVPLIFFGLPMPSLFNPLAWLVTFVKIEAQLLRPYPYDVVVVELGTDGPGQLKQFARYLSVVIGILTAITPEHMEYFDDLAAVAKEELSIAAFSGKLLVNIDLCPAEYLTKLETPYLSYSTKQPAEYAMENITYHADGCSFELMHNNSVFLRGSHALAAEAMSYSITAAAAVGRELGMTPEQIEAGIHTIKPVDGRMQRLRGINDSVIIDDTYNASPVAMKAALDTLYKTEAPQKIAVLGNMNELGKYSEDAHAEIGRYCRAEELDLVITIGSDANQFLAPAAERQGCRVKAFTDPYTAGDYLKGIVKPGAVILAKGSQNGVFAEETVKLLLADQADESRLVRQSGYWLKKKAANFSS